jgi:hypothetical protein
VPFLMGCVTHFYSIHTTNLRRTAITAKSDLNHKLDLDFPPNE